MFKNATIFGIAPKFKFDAAMLSAWPFHPVTELQLESSGWSPVRDGESFVSVGGQVLLHFTQEKKHIPKSAVETLLAEKIAGMEIAPGKKATKELRERIVDDLLPRALATRRRTAVWIDLTRHRLVIDSTSTPVVEAIQKSLIKCFENIGIEDVSWPRAKVITEWLIEEPADFTVDDAVTLQYPGEKGKSVKFKAANLATQDVLTHVQQGGAHVEALAMTFKSRLSFVMTGNVQLRGIKALDIITSAEPAQDADRFDSELMLMTLELAALIDALIAEA